jgi:hypothetical protein
MTTTTTAQLLTLTDALAVAELISYAQRNAKVARLTEGGRVVYGTARSIGDQRGNFLLNTEDVRDGYLRVTSRIGVEYFWPVRELMAEYLTSEFVEYDWDERSE